MDRSAIAALVLAGGEGSRIGGNKPGLHLGDKRLIDFALERAVSWRIPVAVQVRSAQQVATPGFEQVLDIDDIPGPLGGVIAGLHWARGQGADHMLTLACDMPFLPDDMLERLHRVAVQGGTIAIASSGGDMHPVCAVWPVASITHLEASAANGELSLRRVSRSYGQSRVEWPDAPDPFFNINTRDDLSVAEGRLIGAAG